MSTNLGMMRPSHGIKGSAYFPVHPGQRSTESSNQQRPNVVPLYFPATKDVLWDKTPTGESTVLNITKYRNIGLHVLEKSVQLAYRHALQSDMRPYKCFLIGSIISDKDEEGMTLAIDRFDPGRDIPGRGGRMPTARLPGDQVIPLVVSLNDKEPSTTHTVDDFSAAFKVIDHAFSSMESLDVGHALSSRIHCCCYDSADDVTLNLHIGAVTMGNTLEATPISPVPIIPTALARNLTGPLNLSEIQGAPKVGYVTMDQTRKLLLVLESDPKVCTLPLVGIWLSGVSNLCSPFVWAGCLRYMFNNGIHERVCTADRGFLLVMFSPTSRQPAFYECRSLSGLTPSFELVGCRENIHLYKHSNQTSRAPVQLELTTARAGPNRAMFLEAARQYTPSSPSSQVATQSHRLAEPAMLPVLQPLTASEDDVQIVPRPIPKPMIDKSPTVKPSVPELSLIFDSSDEEFGQLVTQPQSAVSQGAVVVNQRSPLQYNQTMQQLSSNLQDGQENPPLNSGQKGHTRFVTQATRAHRGHVDTPHGRPGPLKPVNMNLSSPKPSHQDVQMKHNHNQLRGIKPAPVSNTSAKRSPLGTSKTLSLARRGNHQWPADGRTRSEDRPMIRTPESDFAPRQKPPRPTANNTESSMPANVTNPKSAPCHEKRRAAPRRMSYPVPAKSHQQRAHYSNDQAHTHQYGNPATPHVKKSLPKTDSTKKSSGDSRGPINIMNSAMTPSYGGFGHPPNASEPQSSSVIQTTSSQSPCAASFPQIAKTLSFTPCNPPSPPPASNFQSVQNPAVAAISSQPPHRIHGAPGDRCPVKSDSPNTQPNCMDSVAPQVTPTSLLPTSPSPLPQDGTVHHHSSALTATSDNLAASGSSPEVEPVSLESQPSVAGKQARSSNRGAALETNEAMVQLKRQELLIQQLQAQIQMLLQAQTSQPSPPLPSGLITPPSTPTSQETNSQQFMLTPTPQILPNPHATLSATTAQTHLADGENNPPLKTTCEMAVMTGKSLLWPDGTSSPVQKSKSNTSVGTSMTPRASPSNEIPVSPPVVTKATPEFDLELTLPPQQTRDNTRSSEFIVSTGDYQSFSEGNNSSLARISAEKSPNESRLHHDAETPPTYPMDSFQSPVLGESASTCAPPRRRRHYSGCNDISSDNESSEDSGADESKTDGEFEMDSLLKRDEQKFYQNFLGKVEKMLADQFSTVENEQQDSGRVHVTHQELMKLGLAPPKDHHDLASDTSLVYRSTCMVNSDFYPRINYVSLMDVHLDSPNLSYEANAIAMKYLTEEELTQLSAGFKSQATTPQHKVNPLLRTALTGMGDVSTGAGLSAVDLSMASRKYMEKYGLLETRMKPDRARALGFDSNDEATIQPVVTKTLAHKIPDKSKDRKNLHQKKDSKGKEKMKTRAPGSPSSAGQEKLQVTPATIGQQFENKKQNANANIGEDIKNVNDENNHGSNILDIERLKQLPKLF